MSNRIKATLARLGIHNLNSKLKKALERPEHVRTPEREPISEYNDAAQRTFGVPCHMPNTRPATSFLPASPWGRLIIDKMLEVEVELARTLLEDLDRREIPGALVEFGVFAGAWLERLLGMTKRQILGFDSFAGLPALTSADHGMGWEEGMYAASYEDVAKRLDLPNRPNLHLLKGWFSDTVKTAVASGITQVAFARIDCDLYRSAVDALHWIGPRLVPESVLVFDDWTFDLSKGETKAFFEWLPASGRRFALIGHLGIGHLYLRTVH